MSSSDESRVPFGSSASSPVPLAAVSAAADPGVTVPGVTVVICAYTEERWTEIEGAVASVLAQDPPPGDVVLVIDHNDALLQRSRAGLPDSITIVANKHHRGLSGARNTGIEHAEGEIIAFLDDDAAAHPRWLAHLIAPYSDPAVVGVGGRIDPQWQTRRPAWWPAEFDWVIGCSYLGMPVTSAEVRNPIGANMSVRRSAFDAVGGFSPAIGRVGKHPVGCEETELFIRIRQHTKTARVIYEPRSAVDHLVPSSRAGFDYFRARCYAEGLSKAVVSKLVGSGDGLASERTYTFKTLPSGVVRGIKDGLRGHPGGFGRAAAITGGLLLTTAGYIRGRLAKGPERHLIPVPDHRASEHSKPARPTPDIPDAQ